MGTENNSSSVVDHELLRKSKSQPLSVLEAKRKHTGTWTIIGKIVTVSEMYVIEVAPNPPEQPEPEYKDAKFIQLEDIDNLDENERLDVILYNDDISNVVPGEVIEITGNFELKQKNKKIKVLTVIVNATSIKYVNRKELVITPRDIENINRFASLPNLTERLTAMFAPNVIGHDRVRLGVLRSMVGGSDHGQRGGGRVNTLLVGDPGTAKSTIGQEAAKIKPNSRHVSAPHASSKTITAIAEKENETVSLKLGALPLARGAICAIDEITEFPLEEQGRLLSVLEEGEFPLDKHGRSWRIYAPTAIIATANPLGSRWSNREMISNDEINMRKTLLDRFQQVYYFRDDMDEDQIDEFVNAMSAINKRRPHNYNFLAKYIIHSSGIEIKTVTREAEIMLNAFWKQAKLERNTGVRMYVGLYSIAQAHAKLHLKDTIDANIAKEAIELVQMMMAQTGPTVKAPTDPKVVTRDKFIEILQNNEVGVAIKALCEIGCRESPQVALYVGKNWSLESNMKLRAVIGMLREHSQVKEINSNPIVFKWIGPRSAASPDASDTSDTTTLKEKSMIIKQNSTTGGTSEASDVSGRNRAPVYECPRCPFKDLNPSNITEHRIKNHEQDREPGIV
jgi:MoxR-like ATPase